MMEVKINNGKDLVDATIEMRDGVMIVSPKAEKYVPKNGDVVNVDGYILLFKKTRGSLAPSLYSHVTLINNILHFDLAVAYTKIRPATEEEKKKLFDKLAEEGWEWKADTKELVKLKWKPKLGDPYFSPSFSNTDFLFKASKHIYTGHFSDEMTIGKMRAFKTKEECQLFCDKLNQTVNEYEL